MTEEMDLVTMIRDSAAAVAPRDGGYARIRSLRYKAPGFDPRIYREMAGMGWIGLRLPEEQGGVGLGMRESIALYEELGRGLVPEPLIASTLSASLLASADHDGLGSLLAGEMIVATAWSDRPDSIDVATDNQAPRRGVIAADQASHILVPTGGTLRLVDAASVDLETVELQDGGRMSLATIAPNAGQMLGGGLEEAFAKALDEAALGTAAYLLGVAEAAFAMTLDYLKQRKQFGQPLAAFQTLQHRAADLQIQITLARASITGAAADLDRVGSSPRQRALAVSRAKARAADTALLVGREAIQMHGAIGYTDEYDVGLFSRKAMVLANRYGSASLHRRRYVALAEDLAA